MVSRLTAMTIQSWPDAVGAVGGLSITTSVVEGKWASFLYLVKGGFSHSLLLSTTPIFDSSDEAEAAMREIVEKVRASPNLVP